MALHKHLRLFMCGSGFMHMQTPIMINYVSYIIKYISYI